MTEDYSQFEKKILKGTLILSFGFHIFLAFISFFPNKRNLPKPRRTITAEFHLPKSINDKKLAVNKKNKIKETVVDKKTLPQLPKKFVIKEKPKEVKSVRHSLEDKKKKREEEEKRKKKEDAIELSKKEALERLLKEKARLQKKNALEEKLALKEELDKIRLLKSRKKAEGDAYGAELIDSESYGEELQSWLHQNYELPEAFDLSIQKNEVLLEIVLNSEGRVLSAKVAQASKNPVFDKFALNTVWKASPFPKPPAHWAQKKIQLHFTP